MNTSTSIGRGLGITAGLDAGLARDLAAHCERLGYHSLWSNDEPASPGLETLAHFAAAATQLELGVGALPLDRHQPVQIAADIDRLGLDPAKLWIGIGSGQLRAPIEIVRRAVAELRQLLPETHIVVAAMRPRLCSVGGAIADGVLLNWMLPAQAAAARQLVKEAADEAGRPAPVVASYIRVAIGSGAWQRLRDEENHYRNVNEDHRQHFAAINMPLGSVGVAASSATESRRRTGALPPRARPPNCPPTRRTRPVLAARCRERCSAVSRSALRSRQDPRRVTSADSVTRPSWRIRPASENRVPNRRGRGADAATAHSPSRPPTPLTPGPRPPDERHTGGRCFTTRTAITRDAGVSRPPDFGPGRHNDDHPSCLAARRAARFSPDGDRSGRHCRPHGVPDAVDGRSVRNRPDIQERGLGALGDPGAISGCLRTVVDPVCGRRANSRHGAT